MNDSLLDISRLILQSYTEQMALYSQQENMDLKQQFKLNLVDFLLFCSIYENQFSNEELDFLNRNLELNLNPGYVQLFRAYIPNVNSFDIPETFCNISTIRNTEDKAKLLETCLMFYQLFGQNYFQVRDFTPETLSRFNFLMESLRQYIQSILLSEQPTNSSSQSNTHQNNLNQSEHGSDNTRSENNSEGQSEKPEEEPLPERSEENLKKCMDELSNMIGLQRVKEDVTSLVNLLTVRKKREEMGLPQLPMSLHLVFTGNPGTGKTTVARLLAQIYYQLGILSKGQLVETDRAGLVAGYVGQTAIKTKEVAEKAIGGVLFIDEAYTLKVDHATDFGQEAIDTLLKIMEDNRNNLVVIVAGYPDLMEGFLKSNPGLESRFNKFMHFDDYTPSELVSIYKSFADSSKLIVEPEIEKILLERLEGLYQNRDKSFSNGRLVRNIFEKSVAKQANRIADHIDNCTQEEITTIKCCDIPENWSAR